MTATAGRIVVGFPTTLRLNWWTRHRAVGTKHAAIAWLRPELRAAAGALVQNLAGVGTHRFRLCGPTIRAGNG